MPISNFKKVEMAEQKEIERQRQLRYEKFYK